MPELNNQGIYLITEFDWPKEITSNMAEASANLHKLVNEAGWIEECMAGYSGLRSGFACIWIFKMKNYASLDKLLNSEDNEVATAYALFFN